MENTRKSYNMNLSDKKYHYIIQATHDNGLPFSAYANLYFFNNSPQLSLLIIRIIV